MKKEKEEKESDINIHKSVFFFFHLFFFCRLVDLSDPRDSTEPCTGGSTGSVVFAFQRLRSGILQISTNLNRSQQAELGMEIDSNDSNGLSWSVHIFHVFCMYFPGPMCSEKP